MKTAGNVATLIERYFTERLMRQRNVSLNTIASYRDTFSTRSHPTGIRSGCCSRSPRRGSVSPLRIWHSATWKLRSSVHS
jgi:hypothetical protein